MRPPSASADEPHLALENQIIQIIGRGDGDLHMGMGIVHGGILHLFSPPWVVLSGACRHTDHSMRCRVKYVPDFVHP